MFQKRGPAPRHTNRGEFAMRGIGRSDDRDRRFQKVGNCGAFAHELGIHADAKVSSHFLSAGFFQGRDDDGLGRARQHRAPQYHQMERVFLRRAAPISWQTGPMWPRSSLPLRMLGVPTQRKEISVSRTAFSESEVACKRQAFWDSAIRSATAGSTIGLRPLPRASTLAALRSTPVTRFPRCARQAAVTVPTYPKPKMLIARLMRRLYPFLHRIAKF